MTAAAARTRMRSVAGPEGSVDLKEALKSHGTIGHPARRCISERGPNRRLCQASAGHGLVIRELAGLDKSHARVERLSQRVLRVVAQRGLSMPV